MGGSGIRRSLPPFNVALTRAQGALNPRRPSGMLDLKIEEERGRGEER